MLMIAKRISYHFILLCLCIAAVEATAQPSLDSIAQRLQVLEDKEEIRTLLQNYGLHVDDRNWEDFAELFASNRGTWDGGMGVATGRDEILQMMRTAIDANNKNAGGNGYSNVHLLSNEIIDVDGNTAQAVSKWVFVMTGEDGPNVVLVGRYLDDFVKEQGAWKFQNRKVMSDISSSIRLGDLNDANN